MGARSVCGHGMHTHVLASRLRDRAPHISPLIPSCSNLFEWAVTVLGPPDTLYEGGFFNAILKFPPDYPQSPPDCRFTSAMWHPNGRAPDAGGGGV